MSESNNNTPMRITQLEEATAYEDGMYYAVAKAGSGTKKISCDLTAKQSDIDNIKDILKVRQKTINNATINSSGVIETTTSDKKLVCFEVYPKLKISITGTIDIYALYTNEPNISSTSYNGGRAEGTISNFIIPDGCYWLAIRTNTSNALILSPTDGIINLLVNNDGLLSNEIEAESARIDTINEKLVTRQGSILDASIDSGGTITTGALKITYFEVMPKSLIKSVSSGFDLYAFYENMPEMGSTSYNSSRAEGAISNLIVPDNCHWLAVRSVKTVYPTINPSNGMIGILSNEIEAINNKLIAIPTYGQVNYRCGTSLSSGHRISNIIAYKDGVIIEAKEDGKITRINFGTSEDVLSLPATKAEWRCLWMDKNENVFASPHTADGTLAVSDRGLYRLVKGESSFQKVLSLDDGTTNDDTIWNMCEDESYLYAGVYAHTLRNNPSIYRSSDGGATWSLLINFNTAGLTNNGKHIHAIEYNPYNKSLYCIVGEVNTIFKSTDHGNTWTDLHVTLVDKGTTLFATPKGMIVGSDNAYNVQIDILCNDDVTHKTLYKGWANTVFAMRKSDITGFIYAFTKIDSSVNVTSYYPPSTILSAETPEEIAEILATWRTAVGNTIYNKWLKYHNSVVDTFPDDCYLPTHYGILVSRDGGDTWEILFRIKASPNSAPGFRTGGRFVNGECAGGIYAGWEWKNPIAISEGKHKYVEGGCDFEGEILIRTNTSSIAPLL